MPCGQLGGPSSHPRSPETAFPFSRNSDTLFDVGGVVHFEPVNRKLPIQIRSRVSKLIPKPAPFSPPPV
jgi:hypothetical protein